jgi:hypothetical protein
MKSKYRYLLKPEKELMLLEELFFLGRIRICGHQLLVETVGQVH